MSKLKAIKIFEFKDNIKLFNLEFSLFRLYEIQLMIICN
jgi:hypothetical protein